MRAAVLALLLACLAAPARAETPAPWLGVGIDRGARGVHVNEVVADTPADVAGLVAGDEILAVGDRPTRAPDELVRAVGAKRVGDRVLVRVARGAAIFDVEVRLSARLDEHELLARRLVDRPAPRFELPALDPGVSGRLADHRGKVVVLEFWATFCQPCKRTFAPLAELAAAHPGKLVVLGVASEPTETLRAFLAQHRLGFPVLRDPGGATRLRYRTTVTPTLVVIDRDGVVRYAGLGAGATLRHAVRAAEAAVGE